MPMVWIKYARKLGYDETMACLSLPMRRSVSNLAGTGRDMPFAVMLNMADAVLSASAEKNISSSERGRAGQIIFEEFAGA